MDTWTCRSCGWNQNGVTETSCAKCQTTRPLGAATTVYHRREDGAPPPAGRIAFPYVIKDIRFLSGATWTSGMLIARAEGWILVAEKDTPRDVTKLYTVELPATKLPISIASISFFIPLEAFRRVTKSTTSGYTLEAGDGKFPLRFSVEDRPHFAALCAFVGFPI